MPHLIKRFWLDHPKLYHVYLLQIVIDISWLGNGWISHNKYFMKHYLTPSKVSTLGNEFDFQTTAHHDSLTVDDIAGCRYSAYIFLIFLVQFNGRNNSKFIYDCIWYVFKQAFYIFQS